MACLYCGSETDRCISADEAAQCGTPKTGYVIRRNSSLSYPSSRLFVCIRKGVDLQGFVRRMVWRCSPQSGSSVEAKVGARPDVNYGTND